MTPAIAVPVKNLRNVMGNKIYTLRVKAIDRNIFEAIKSGKKKIETRAATSKYAGIKAGDGIVFVCGKNKFEKTVKKAELFKTIRALVKKYKPTQVNPYCKTESELRDMWYSFPDYQEKIKKHGLIAFEIE